jgi:predicted DNA binding CopG/RHH family protein
MVPIRSPEDIPEPMDQATAAHFYDTHEFTAEALDALPDASAEFTGAFVRTRPISIRFPEPMLAELKRVAAQKGVAYQALIKVWLDERLQQERAAASGVSS